MPTVASGDGRVTLDVPEGWSPAEDVDDLPDELRSALAASRLGPLAIPATSRLGAGSVTLDRERADGRRHDVLDSLLRDAFSRSKDAARRHSELNLDEWEPFSTRQGMDGAVVGYTVTGRGAPHSHLLLAVSTPSALIRGGGTLERALDGAGLLELVGVLRTLRLTR